MACGVHESREISDYGSTASARKRFGFLVQKGPAGDSLMSLATWLIVLCALGLIAFALIFAFIPACDKV